MNIIPLSNGAAQSHQIQFMQLGENFVEMRINYVTLTKDWVMDCLVEGELKIAGMMLKPDAQISQTFGSDIGIFVFVGDEPTLDNLGVSNYLGWSSE